MDFAPGIVGPDLAKFCLFIFFGNILKLYLKLGKISNQLWQILGKFSFVINGKIKKHITVWSHWPEVDSSHLGIKFSTTIHFKDDSYGAGLHHPVFRLK